MIGPPKASHKIFLTLMIAHLSLISSKGAVREIYGIQLEFCQLLQNIYPLNKGVKLKLISLPVFQTMG